MDAKYIKKEIADLNGTGRTQAYYKMVTRVMNHEQFIDVLMRDGKVAHEQQCNDNSFCFHSSNHFEI